MSENRPLEVCPCTGHAEQSVFEYTSILLSHNFVEIFAAEDLKTCITQDG